MSEGSIIVSGSTELTPDEKAYAGLAHALMISTWWIGPLVVYLLQRKSRFVAFHSLQALFWQVIFTLLYLVGMVVLFAGMINTMSPVPGEKAIHPPPFPTTFFLVFPIFWLVVMGGFAISITLGIVYCLKAMRGEWAAYPIIGRWADRIVRS
ncbi:MAG TPA: DUF4870 domain-containing protein [Candidatus Acidoferrum sp.]|jgi:uncharacterized membrane protein